MIIRPVGDELFHADGQTDIIIVAFRNFANAPDKGTEILKERRNNNGQKDEINKKK
jgi:hypothetical protein